MRLPYLINVSGSYSTAISTFNIGLLSFVVVNFISLLDCHNFIITTKIIYLTSISKSNTKQYLDHFVMNYKNNHEQTHKSYLHSKFNLALNPIQILYNSIVFYWQIESKTLAALLLYNYYYYWYQIKLN